MKLTNRARNTLLLLLAAVPAAVVTPRLATLRLSEIPGIVSSAPATVAELPAQVTTELVAVADGKHLGFDTNVYPGDRAMRAWRADGASGDGSPYEWVGYYLPAPCHKDGSWSGRRQALSDMGWGLAVIYVGQQTWDGIDGPSAAAVARARRRGTLACHRSLLTAAQGREEADDAIARTAAEGFAEGTTIYLDVEYMDLVPPRMREYYRAWVARVLADGRYRPGVYVHTRNATLVHRDVRAVYADAGIAAEPPIWVAGGGRFKMDKGPRDVGHDFAHMWQGLLDVVQTWNGVTLPIDVNVAATPSPSASEYAPNWSLVVARAAEARGGERFAAGD